MKLCEFFPSGTEAAPSWLMWHVSWWCCEIQRQDVSFSSSSCIIQFVCSSIGYFHNSYFDCPNNRLDAPCLRFVLYNGDWGSDLPSQWSSAPAGRQSWLLISCLLSCSCVRLFTKRPWMKFGETFPVKENTMKLNVILKDRKNIDLRFGHQYSLKCQVFCVNDQRQLLFSSQNPVDKEENSRYLVQPVL